jgi:hypothetical protein
MEQRTVTGFSKLVFKAVGRVELTQGESESLTIEASPEICSRVVTEIVNDTLTISYSSDWQDWLSTPLFGKDSLVYHLQMKTIQSILLSGAGNLTAEKITVESAILELSGPGAITINELTATDIKVGLSGVGSMNLKGKATSQLVTLDGAGSYDGDKLETEKTEVRLEGVGNARVWANTELIANISGAGAIQYYGHPKVEQRISGIGALKSLS